MAGTNTTKEVLELTAVDKTGPGLRSAEEGLVRLRTGLDTVRGAMGALGVTVGAGAMISFARDVLRSAAALDDMAEATGASVEGLSAIQRVARIGGHDFDGLTSQIGRMVKGLREGSEEGGRAAQAFEFLNIQTKTADGRFRDTSEILVELAQKLNRYGDSGDKVALVQDALGRGAERYLPLLKEMGEGTDLVTTTTAEQAAKAEQLLKNLERLQTQYMDLGKSIVYSALPAMVDFTDAMVKAHREGGTLLGTMKMMAEAANRLGGTTPFGLIGRAGSAAIDVYSSSGAPRASQADIRRFEPVEQAALLYRPETEEQRRARSRALEQNERERMRLLAQDAANWVRAIEKAQDESEDLVYTWNIAGERVVLMRKEWERMVELQDKGAQIFSDALIAPLVESAQALVEESEKLIYTWDEFGNRVVTTQDEIDRAAEAARRMEEEIRRASERQAEEARRQWERTADAIENALANAIMQGGRNGFELFIRSIQTAILTPFISALVRPIAEGVASAVQGGMISGMSGATSTGYGGMLYSAGAGYNVANSGMDFGGPGVGYSANPWQTPSGGFNWMGGIGAGLVFLGGAQQYQQGNKTQGALTMAGTAIGSFWGPAGAMVGGAIGSAIGGFFGGDGDAMRTAGFSQGFGQAAGWGASVNTQRWFDPTVAAGVGELSQAIALQEQNLIRNLGLTGAQIEAVNQALAGLSGRRYEFGMEHTDWRASGAAQRISADRISAIATALGRSMEELTAVMQLSAEQWEAAIEQLRTAEEQAEMSLRGFANSLPEALGITQLEGFQRSLAVSPTLSPLDQLAGARAQYEDFLSRAMSGEREAIFGFPDVAQQLLGIGRDVYASGTGYQDLFREVNTSLNQVLERQRAEQTELMTGLQFSLEELRVSWIDELKATKFALVQAMNDVRTQLERMNAG